MTPEAKRWVEFAFVLLTAALSGAAAYYNMDARVLLIEQQVKIESQARITGQSEIRNRLDTVDAKMDRIGDKMEKIKDALYERR